MPYGPHRSSYQSFHVNDFSNLLVASVKYTVYVPACEVSEVFEQCLLDLIECLGLFLLCVQVERDHGLRLRVIRVLFEYLLRISE